MLNLNPADVLRAVEWFWTLSSMLGVLFNALFLGDALASQRNLTNILNFGRLSASFTPREIRNLKIIAHQHIRLGALLLACQAVAGLIGLLSLTSGLAGNAPAPDAERALRSIASIAGLLAIQSILVIASYLEYRDRLAVNMPYVEKGELK